MIANKEVMYWKEYHESVVETKAGNVWNFKNKVSLGTDIKRQ